MHEINFEKLTTLPGSMGDMYMKNFKRIFPNTENYVEVKEFISIIVAAQEPLELSFISSAMKINLDKIIENTSLLFPLREGKFYL